MRKNLLLPGVPGVGKTTVLRRVARALEGQPVRGFLTDEIRGGGTAGGRTGFRIESLDGRVATLAHVRLASPHRVGRYHVDLGALNGMVDHALAPGPAVRVFLIDEIGKMECLSARFVTAVERLLDGPTPVVATVSLKGAGFMAAVKQRPDAETWEVTVANRDELPGEVLRWLSQAAGSP